MLQSRRQDLEAQIRSLREEVDKGQGRLQSTHEELLLLQRERREHSLEVNYGGVGWVLSNSLKVFWEMWPLITEAQHLGHKSVGMSLGQVGVTAGC